VIGKAIRSSCLRQIRLTTLYVVAPRAKAILIKQLTVDCQAPRQDQRRDANIQAAVGSHAHYTAR